MRLHKWLLLAGTPLLLAGSSALAQVVSGPPRNITPDTQSTEGWVKVNANGTKISWTGNAGQYNASKTWEDIYVANPDGSDRVKIQTTRQMSTEESGHVSPDGKRIVFHSFGSLTARASGATDIYVYDIPTGQTFRMTTAPQYDAYPVWNHDGTQIAFISQRASSTYEMFIMNAVDAGGNVTPESATNVPVQLSMTSTTPGIVTGMRMSFSPDGKMVFLGKEAGRTAAFDLFIADPTDTNGDKQADNIKRLTDYATAKVGGNVNFYDPVMPKAGGRVFFYSANLSPDGRNHVYSLDPSGVIGGDPTQVNKDIWQVTGAPFEETFHYAGGNILATSMSNDDNSSGGIGVDNRDVAVYTLVDDSTPGSLSGRLVSSLGEPAVGNLVELFNGANKIATTTTDSQGSYAFADLRPGGYYVRFSSVTEGETPDPVLDTTVGRSVLIAPGGQTTQDAFTSPRTSRRPRGVVPTIQNGKVSIRWQPDPESQLINAAGETNWVYKGFNVWRGATENGPWTKINTALVPPATIYEFVDETPGDLTKAFYTVTSVTENPASPGTTLESMYADAGQAANNLLFNPSFEVVDAATSTARGWEPFVGALVDKTTVYTNPAGATIGVDTANSVVGSNAQYHDSGTLPDPVGLYKSSEVYAHTTVPYFAPIDPEQSYINAAYAKFQDTTNNKNTERTRMSFSVTEPNAGAYEWYGTGQSTNTVTSPGTPATTDWQWLYNTNTLRPYEFATLTRFSTFMFADLTSNNHARALFDEVRYQVKRVGATGIVWGRVVNSEGVGVSGVKVTDGTLTTYTEPSGAFYLRDMPTGPATITVTYPGQPTITETVQNIGGYRFPTDFVYTGTIVAGAGGRILLPTGAPAAGANVRMVVGKNSETIEKTYTATTNANGEYTFDTTSEPLDTAQHAWVVASLAPYQSAVLSDRAFGVGVTRFDMRLGMLVPELQVARTSGAITIDGQLNEASWAKAQPLPLSYLYPTLGAPAAASTGYMLWDNDNLYVGYTASEPSMSTLKATATGADAVEAPNNVFADDHVEVFLDPTVGAGIGFGHEFWQIAANANTTDIGYGDALLRNAPDPQALAKGKLEGTTMEVKATQAADSYTVEMRIPFSGLKTFDMDFPNPTVGTQWRSIIGRLRTADGQFSSTSYITGGFVNAHLWNTLTFVNTVTGKKGDLTGNQIVDREDVIEALKVTAGITALGNRLPQGDVVNDNAVNLQDAARIMRYLSGLDPNMTN